MKRPIATFLLLLLCSSFVSAQPNFELSYLLVRSRDGSILQQQEAEKLRTPASTIKIVTAAAALERLGPSHKYLTRVLAVNRPHRGRLKGHLTLQGDADPELTMDALNDLCQQLQASGLRRVEGDLIVDEGAFANPPYGQGWAWDDTGEGYSPEITGLAIDGGVISLGPGFQAPWLFHQPKAATSVQLVPGREGVLVQGEPPKTLAPPHSSLRTGEIFRQALKRHGIQLRGEVRLGQAQGEPLAVHASRPLEAVLQQALGVSDNLAMELVHRSSGEVLPQALQGEELRRVDGSGLSRYNLISAAQLVKVLQGRPELKTLLPAGGEGTLKQRFLQGPVVGKQIRAKTGTLGNISGLTGYLFPDTPQEMRFAILINGHVGPSTERKSLENELVAKWARQYQQP